MVISYCPRYKGFVMEAFGVKEKNGVLVDSKTENEIVDNAGGRMVAVDFNGVRKGSIEFINKDVVSLLKLKESLESNKKVA